MSSSITEFLGRWLGLEQAQSIEGYEPSLGASWAHSAPAWVFFGCLVLSAVAIFFYARYQRHRHAGARVVLAIFRAAALSLILLMLAEPVLTVKVTSRMRPSLWVLFDGTDSMAITDELSEADRAELAAAVGLKNGAMPGDKSGSSGNSGSPGASGGPSGAASIKNSERSRIDYVKALVAKPDNNVLARLGEKFRLRAFLFDRAEGVRSLELTADGREGVDGPHLARQLTTEGQVTALGSALDDLARRHATANLAGLVILSDFNQNAGPAAPAAARRLGVAAYTVGVGATTAVDVAVSLQAPLHVKKDERSSVEVTVRQQGLDGQSVSVLLSARRLGGLDSDATDLRRIADKPVTLTGAVQTVEFPYVPDKAGRFVLVAEVEPVAGEVVEENNRSQREITVTDDFLRLLYAEYEPTWEWRFIKEVFHRDKLVGMEGFHTFLRSSDPRVRQSNPMFLPTMSPPRSEFFAHDVIFLGDMPASALSPRFCEMAEEFVKNFGGGLVILSGPRFGPGQLVDTPLARLLPVKVDPNTRIYDRQPLRLQLTAMADRYDFMQLGGTTRENQKAWDNLGPLEWYQPVERLHPLAVALAEHPNHTCVDGKTRQPLIAIRRYGRGEVVYLGFDETWRLRRKFGERYYRQFWGQMIHRLALSHALGAQKRFVVQTDRRRYQADDEVLLTVEAYNAQFEPLGEADLLERKLHAELILPERAGGGDNVQPLSATQLRKGVFEARFPVYAGGEYRLRVTDPITEKPVETTFQVASVAVERQRAIRNVALQQVLAAETGGKTYDLTNVARLANEIELVPKTETSIEVIPLWDTWLSFVCLVGLLLGEWFLRKWVNLP